MISVFLRSLLAHLAMAAVFLRSLLTHLAIAAVFLRSLLAHLAMAAVFLRSLLSHLEMAAVFLPQHLAIPTSINLKRRLETTRGRAYAERSGSRLHEFGLPT